MYKFIKRHWFGLIVIIVALIYLIMFLLVMLSPRQDKFDRGFIPCTKQMVSEIFNCKKNKYFCMATAIIKNGTCDAKVIFTGLNGWIEGKQPTPWHNYLFTPEVANDNVNDAELQKFYDENPDIAAQMEELARQSREQNLNMEDDNEQTLLPAKNL